MTIARENLSGTSFPSTCCDMTSGIHRIEAENRQLHQIVSQLRTARRTTQENVDTALADQQSSRETIEQQRRELNDLREKLKNYHTVTEENSRLLATVVTTLPPMVSWFAGYKFTGDVTKAEERLRK